MSTKEIIAVAENNVEVKEYIIDKATDKKHYIGETKSYGELRLSEETVALQKQLDYWKALDVKKYKEEQIAKLTAQLTELEPIRVEMDKVKTKPGEETEDA